jgi:Ribonuclease G/E
MKGRLVVLGQMAGREAAALLVDGRLEDLLLDPGAAAGFRPGAILRATAGRPVKGQGGLFVTLPEGRSGYLRDGRGIAPGKPLLVQVAGPAEPGKAQPVTTRLLFRGRHAILSPGAPGINLSRRIRDEPARARLTRLGEAAMAGSEDGLILRSASLSADEEDIAAEIAALRQAARQVTGDAGRTPDLLLDGPGPHETAWIDWADPAPDEVDAGDDAFARHGIPDLAEAARAELTPLPGGGSLAIAATRALVAVDVNTGTDTSPAAGLKANIAAARDLPRQLRLRGLGGIVVIDLAPMPKRDRAAFEQQLRTAFRADGSETVLAGWTPLGNYELQRRRDRVPLETIIGAQG